MNFKVSVLFLFFFCIVYSAESSVVVWQSGINGTWNNPVNWVGGVLPAASDSVLIEGSGSVARVVATARALHVSVMGSASFGIATSGELIIEDSPGNGMFLEDEVLIQKGGVLEISNVVETAIAMEHSLINDGVIKILNCKYGFRVTGNSSFDIDTLFNNGIVEILDIEKTGVFLFYGVISNSGKLEITECEVGLSTSVGSKIVGTIKSNIKVVDISSTGISLIWGGELVNEGSITLEEFDNTALRVDGALSNYGTIVIGNATTGGTSILIDSILQVTVRIGSITNYEEGNILIDNVESGFLMAPSTTLINSGNIEITNSLIVGLEMEEKSSTQLSSGSTMSVGSIDAPMVIHEEATLEIDLDAVLSIDL